MKKTAVAVLAIVCFGIAARVLLRPRLDARAYIRMNPVLRVLDTNGDGTVSAAEIAGAAGALRTLDANHDGMLSEDETAYVFEGRPGSADEMAGMLMSFDRNGDGKLTREEVPERMQGLFDRGDKNRDGVLTAREIHDLALHTPPPGDTRGGGRDPVVATLDTNHDGAISKEEIDNAPAALRTLDRNGDGKLTADEFRALLPRR
jgi:Ca2+-binding EF-hand superfamily protein